MCMYYHAVAYFDVVTNGNVVFYDYVMPVFYVLSDFPKTASGKIRKYQLSQIERVKVFDANFQ